MRFSLEQLIKSYIISFLHPFKTHDYFKGKNSHFHFSWKPIPLSFAEAISLSWVFVIINGLYALATLQAGPFMLEELSEKFPLAEYIGQLNYTTQKAYIMAIFLGVVIFPLNAYIYSRVLHLCFGLSFKLISPDENKDKAFTEVINHSFSSYFFLLIPIFGKSIRFVSQGLNLFAGLRNNLGLNAGQAFFMLISPLILSALTVILFFLIIMIFISLL